jgi:hypothetical protein
VLPATDAQHPQKSRDRVLHFKKLAALVKKIENTRDAQPQPH